MTTRIMEANAVTLLLRTMALRVRGWSSIFTGIVQGVCARGTPLWHLRNLRHSLETRRLAQAIALKTPVTGGCKAMVWRARRWKLRFNVLAVDAAAFPTARNQQLL